MREITEKEQEIIDVLIEAASVREKERSLSEEWQLCEPGLKANELWEEWLKQKHRADTLYAYLLVLVKSMCG